MAYDDWAEGMRDLWDSLDGTAPGYMEDWERAYAETEFERGFTHTGEEYDAMGLDPDQVYAARMNFFDFMGLEEEDFDWDAWREEMGYND